MAISNVVYLNRIEAARSRKRLRTRPARIPIETSQESVGIKEFLEAIKGRSERQAKLSQY